jgi:hypothetical protein
VNDGNPPQNSLAALGAHLSARNFVVELAADGLHVANPEAAGLVDTITCRPRVEDGGRPWFWSVSGEPIAEADQIINASVDILGRLAARHLEAPR